MQALLHSQKLPAFHGYVPEDLANNNLLILHLWHTHPGTGLPADPTFPTKVIPFQ